MTSTFRIVGGLAVVAAVLHFVWENSHVGLYTGYDALGGGLPITVWATVGDVLYTLAAFALASLFKHGIWWVRDTRWYDYIGLACLGFFIALYVEYKAIALGRWAYLPDMPLLAGFDVGLSPVLQMVILLPLTVGIVALLERRVRDTL